MVKEGMEARLKVLAEAHKVEEVHEIARKLEEEWLNKITDSYDKEEVIAVVMHSITNAAKRSGAKDLENLEENIRKELVAMSFEMFSGLILTGIHLVSMFQAVEQVEMELARERGN